MSLRAIAARPQRAAEPGALQTSCPARSLALVPVASLMVLPGIPDGFPETAHSVHAQRSRDEETDRIPAADEGSRAHPPTPTAPRRQKPARRTFRRPTLDRPSNRIRVCACVGRSSAAGGPFPSKEIRRISERDDPTEVGHPREGTRQTVREGLPSAYSSSSVCPGGGPGSG